MTEDENLNPSNESTTLFISPLAHMAQAPSPQPAATQDKDLPLISVPPPSVYSLRDHFIMQPDFFILPTLDLQVLYLQSFSHCW